MRNGKSFGPKSAPLDLAAAVGLGALEKTRAARAERVYNRVMQTRVECGLARSERA